MKLYLLNTDWKIYLKFQYNSLEKQLKMQVPTTYRN